MCSVCLGGLAEKYWPWFGWQIVETIEFSSICELPEMQFSTCCGTLYTIAPWLAHHTANRRNCA
jgi:hypothetical protein